MFEEIYLGRWNNLATGSFNNYNLEIGHVDLGTRTNDALLVDGKPKAISKEFEMR